MLNINPGLMLWTLITFAIAVFILWKYAFGPLQRIIDERRARIRESFEAAEETRSEAQRLLAEYKESLARVRGEAEDIVERARKAGESTKAEILAAAKEQADRRLEQARQQIERDTRAALRDIKGAGRRPGAPGGREGHGQEPDRRGPPAADRRRAQGRRSERRRDGDAGDARVSAP